VEGKEEIEKRRYEERITYRIIHEFAASVDE
jgi:hypothetical protein